MASVHCRSALIWIRCAMFTSPLSKNSEAGVFCNLVNGHHCEDTASGGGSLL